MRQRRRGRDRVEEENKGERGVRVSNRSLSRQLLLDIRLSMGLLPCSMILGKLHVASSIGQVDPFLPLAHVALDLLVVDWEVESSLNELPGLAPRSPLLVPGWALRTSAALTSDPSRETSSTSDLKVIML